MLKIIIAFLMLIPFIGQAKMLSESQSAAEIKELKGLKEFKCVHEKYDEPSNLDVNELYDYAKYLDDTENVYSSRSIDLESLNKIGRYYRIASAYGKTEAKIELYYLLGRYNPDSAMYSGVTTKLQLERNREIDGIADDLINNNMALGYGILATRLEFSGEPVEAIPYRYIAAKLGHEPSQYMLGHLIDRFQTVHIWSPVRNVPIADKLAQDFYYCAAENGNFPDAYPSIARIKMMQGKYEGILPLLQKSVNQGSAYGARMLLDIFSGKPLHFSESRKQYIGIKPDKNRSERYEIYRLFLIGNQYNYFIIPDVNEFIPLPPAGLPAFSGHLPEIKRPIKHIEKPSEEKIIKLAKDKNLNPKTGLPL